MEQRKHKGMRNAKYCLFANDFDCVVRAVILQELSDAWGYFWKCELDGVFR